MDILDFIEAWWGSLQLVFESAGVAARFERSPGSRPNSSCTLNLRQGRLETDLVVWESGEAELAVVGPDGSILQTHFDDVRDRQELTRVFAQLASMLDVDA